jgi:hypothetical protein
VRLALICGNRVHVDRPQRNVTGEWCMDPLTLFKLKLHCWISSGNNLSLVNSRRNILGSFNHSTCTKSCCTKSEANLCTSRSRSVCLSPVREKAPVVGVSSVCASALERRGELALQLLSLRAPSRSTPG